MHPPVRITAPAPILTFDEASKWLRLDDTAEAGLVEGLIAAATAHLDGWAGILGRCLINQDWRISICRWPSTRRLRLPFPDVSVAAVKYFDEANVEQPVDSSKFSLLHDARGALLRLSDSFTGPSLFADRDDAVQVTFTAGYGPEGADVPAPIRNAILLMVSHWFQNREGTGDGSISELPLGVEALVAPYRRTAV